MSGCDGSPTPVRKRFSFEGGGESWFVPPPTASDLDGLTRVHTVLSSGSIASCRPTLSHLIRVMHPMTVRQWKNFTRSGSEQKRESSYTIRSRSLPHRIRTALQRWLGSPSMRLARARVSSGNRYLALTKKHARVAVLMWMGFS